LKIYNDDLVDNNIYEGGNLGASRQPGNGLVVSGGQNPDNETYTVTMKPGAGSWTALGLEVVQDESLPGLRVARGADRLLITEVEAETTEAGRTRKAPFSTATANLNNQAPEYGPIA